MAGRFGPLARRAARPSGRGAVPLIVLLGLMLIPLAAVGAPDESGDPLAPPSAEAVQLTDDDAGVALFDLPAMAPRRPVSRCVTVSYAGAGEVPVSLHAAVNGNGLERYLDMTVETGSGGGFGDCTGFSGEPMFQGTMATFAERYHDHASGLTAFGASAASASRTFRFTFELQDDPAAQAHGVTAAFTWEAQWEPPPGGGGGDGEDPATSTPVEVDKVPSEAPATASRPRRDFTPASPRPKAAQGPAKDAAAGEPPAPEPAGVLTELLRSVGKLAPPVLQRSAFPALLVALLVAFMGVQDRIDRNDPKLAMAPVQAEHLDFEP
jgi:hypothetical protein